uniref:Uncharacterized protein n=1 Tax=Prolemur simus TaxID=1328070 RepID=A0A8C8ZPA9_PROSS
MGRLRWRRKPESRTRRGRSPNLGPSRRGPSLAPHPPTPGWRKQETWMFKEIIRKIQKSTHRLLRKYPFWAPGCRSISVHPFEDAYLLTLLAGPVTLFPKDVQLARRIRSIREGLG